MGTKFYYVATTVIVILLLQFFSFKYLPDGIANYSAFFAGVAILGMFLFLLLFKKRQGERHSLDIIVGLFIFSMFFALINANIYWGQSTFFSLIGFKFYYIYFLYFVFVYISFPQIDAEKIMLLFFYLSVIVFLINAITFPNVIFAWRSEERREGSSFFFYGQGFTALGGFYFLNKYFDKRNLFHLGLFIVSFLCLFFLTRSRNNLIGMALGSLVMILFAKIKNKGQVIAIFLSFVAVVASFSDKIMSKISAESVNQVANYSSDIRYIAHKYFLTTFQSGPLTYLFGNGYPYGNSNLQREIDKLSAGFGFYDSDLGFTGLFIHFGILSILAWLLIFYKVATLKSNKKSTNYIYIKSYFAMLAASALTGFSVFDPGYMPATIFALYILRMETIKVKYFKIEILNENR